MISSPRASRVGAFMLVLTLPFLSGATGLTSNFEERVLAAHNRERTSSDIRPLRWNPGLAASAQAWANRLAATGGFEHAPERATDPEGENIWAGTKGHFPAEAMVNGWIREKRYFKPGAFPNNSVTGKVSDVGHYTQLMWRDTGQVGCAMATGRVEDVMVCRYAQAGNYIGEVPF